MTDTTTPTEEVVDQSSSDIRDESLLEQDNDNSAVERQEDTDSSESTDSDSIESSSDEEQSSSDDDKGLAKFAKSQGFDPDNLTDGERKALKLAHDNQKAYRKQAEEKTNQRKLSEEVEGLTAPEKDDTQNDLLLKRMARFEAKEMANEFWQSNADDRKYEAKMAELLQAEKEQFGADAAWRLAQNMPRLLREAKHAEGAYDSDMARESGIRAERERLRKIQEGAADTSHATTTTNAGGTKKVDMDWVQNEYDPNNPEDRKKLDEAMSRGDLY